MSLLSYVLLLLVVHYARCSCMLGKEFGIWLTGGVKDLQRGDQKREKLPKRVGTVFMIMSKIDQATTSSIHSIPSALRSLIKGPLILLLIGASTPRSLMTPSSTC